MKKLKNRGKLVALGVYVEKIDLVNRVRERRFEEKSIADTKGHNSV